MLQQGVIRPSTSPWAATVEMTSKKDESRRFCLNFCRLNNVTIKDTHLLARINDNLEALHGSVWFTTLDLQLGYWHIPICEQDKHKISTSLRRLYESNVVAFGLCNGPKTCALLMDQIVGDLPVLFR